MNLPAGDASFPVCSQILERYALHYRPIQGGLREASGGFSGARIWSVETARGSFCLRRTETHSLEPARLHGLHRLLRHIHDAGVEQVAVPISTTDGATWVADAQFDWQFEPWMPGQADFARHPGPQRLESAMQCLAQWHRAAVTFVPGEEEAHWFFRSVAPSPGIRERLQLIGNWDSSTRSTVRAKLLNLNWPEFREIGNEVLDLFERLAPEVADQLRVASPLPVPLQPCLRDIWHDHVLFTGERVTGLIDPFASRSDCVATDLARLLGSLLPDDYRDWNFALEAYQRIRPLNADERGLVEVFDVSGTLLSGMTWLDWVCLREKVIAERSRVTSRLTAIIGRAQALLRRRRV